MYCKSKIRFIQNQQVFSFLCFHLDMDRHHSVYFVCTAKDAFLGRGTLSVINLGCFYLFRKMYSFPYFICWSKEKWKNSINFKAFYKNYPFFFLFVKQNDFLKGVMNTNNVKKGPKLFEALAPLANNRNININMKIKIFL